MKKKPKTTLSQNNDATSSSRHVYSAEAIQRCLDEIAKGSSAYAVSKKYGIPRTTLRYWMSSKWQKTTKQGPSTVLSKEEEDKIVSWIIGMQQRGFPVQRRSLLFKVKEFLSASPRKTPFKNDCPGRKWFNSFMQRNSKLSIRTPEEVSSASARVTENDIRSWFQEVYKWLDHHGMVDILADPSRVYNGDETSFYLHPKTKEVIAQKGSRNVYEVEQACGKQNVTVMFSFSATGSVVNPLVILPGQRVRKEVAQGFPPEWGLGQSERGWMTSHNFSEYVKKIFHPFLLREGITLPVIFFVDGHASHVGVEVADLCQQLGVILIALYPNTTRITQPADVSIFKPLKDQWKHEVDDWRAQHPGEQFTLRYFGGVLEKAVEKGIQTDSIVNGFRVCGLCPFDANEVDYSKCIAKPSNNCVPAPVGLLSMDTFDSAAVTVSDTPHESSQSVTGCAEDRVREISSTAAPRLSIDSNDPSSANVNAPFTVCSDYVPIHKDKIKKAVDMMGTSLLKKMQQPSSIGLSHEERVIQYFYKDFIHPFTTFENNSFVPVDNQNEQHTMVEVGNNDTLIGELLIDAEGNVTISATKDTTEEEVIRCLNESIASEHLMNAEAKSSNKPNSTSNNSATIKSVCIENNSTGQSLPKTLDEITNTASRTRKTSISEFLNIPPTPRRSGKHRNYAKKYFPVLTAGERIEEIRKVQKEKQENEVRKNIRAAERAETKRKTEEAKMERAEKRKQKKLNEKSVKQDKENCNLKRVRNVNAGKPGVKAKKIKAEK